MIWIKYQFAFERRKMKQKIKNIIKAVNKLRDVIEINVVMNRLDRITGKGEIKYLNFMPVIRKP